jgi:replicative DNA helicase
LDTIKLRAKLHIQKFIESESLDGNGYQKGGSWRPIAEDDGAKLFIQKGSRMNSDDMADDEDTPF